jgi:hypothetical protein
VEAQDIFHTPPTMSMEYCTSSVEFRTFSRLHQHGVLGVHPHWRHRDFSRLHKHGVHRIQYVLCRCSKASPTGVLGGHPSGGS